MMDIRPLVSAPDSLIAPRDSNLRSLHAVFSPHADSSLTHTPAMIIEASNHSNSSAMPVSPKQGETITADSLSKQEPSLVSSSLTSTSWDTLSPPKASSLPTPGLPASWPTSPLPPVSSAQTLAAIKDNLDTSGTFSASGQAKSPPVSSATPPPHLPLPSDVSQDGGLEGSVPANMVSGPGRNCDRPDSSPSPPPSQLNSSFEEAEHVGSHVSITGLPRDQAFPSNRSEAFPSNMAAFDPGY